MRASLSQGKPDQFGEKWICLPWVKSGFLKQSLCCVASTGMSGEPWPCPPCPPAQPSLSHFTQLLLRSAPRLLLMPWAIYAGRASNALAGLPSCQNRVGVMHTPCVQGGKGCIIAARWPRWFMLCRVTQKLFQPPTNIIPTSYFVTRGQPSPWDTSAVIWKCKIWLMFQISNFG